LLGTVTYLVKEVVYYDTMSDIITEDHGILDEAINILIKSLLDEQNKDSLNSGVPAWLQSLPRQDH